MSNHPSDTEESFVTPLTPFSNTDETDTNRQKHGGGRPKNMVWQYFDAIGTKHAGHFQATCKFCSHTWKIGIVKRLQVHLARECEGVDMDTKNKFMHIVASRDGVEDLMEFEAFQADRNANDNDEVLPAEKAALIDRSILKAFVMCGIPFRVSEHPYFVNVCKSLRSNYIPPSREQLSSNLLIEEAIRVDIKINNSLEISKNLTLGKILEFLEFLKEFLNILIFITKFL